VRGDWASLDDHALLDLRLCDLDLQIEGSILQPRINRLYADLERKGIIYRPHFWLSSEWFAPDGVPGIAAPFYLAHPRLLKLEKRQMLYVEGGGESACLRILRHETGHAIDTAYRLHYRKRWRELFGSYADPYPEFYQPRPGSLRYVQHLDRWYAQAHPAEDFAETFAVWLAPGSRWRQRYRGWPALRKLEFVDSVMKQIAGTPPKVRTRRRVEPLSQLRTTLRDHYREKRMLYAAEWPEFFDADLRRVFSSHEEYRSYPSAAGFLRRHGAKIRDTVSTWTGTHPYTIEQVLRDMIDRCKELKLRLAMPPDDALHQAIIMVTVQTMNHVHSGQYLIPL
jgi:hypothetical protein